MSQSSLNIQSYIQIDTIKVLELGNTINEKNIIHNANSIESCLKKVDANIDLIDATFTVLIEIMQNILNYSSGNKKTSLNTHEAYGTFIVSFDTIQDSILIQASNLIPILEREKIEKKFQEINSLDEKKLRTLCREKRRTKRDVHKKGAGLGFITMALKASKPIQIEFLPVNTETLEYKLTINL